ncbi:MAG: helix-turn-helix domain-containing protein, partial [Anaerolineae bacterium]|nr:helix-turn-helix domain-containing protein [Anaerolineae bacterium]
DFEARGLILKAFIIANMSPSDTSAEKLRDMGLLDVATYTQLQAADAMRDAAQNEGGGAGLTAGIGAGVGIGNVMGEALKGATSSGQPSAGASAGAAAGIPEVMTPGEAATVLKVSEEDVVAAIEAGDLKAKKLGKAYRISKESLEEFLSG